VKVFISFDMEGVAGIVDWSQCRGPGQPYEEGRRLLLGEVNAAIDGAMAGGATEIVCNDSHGTMNNLDPAELHGQAAYVSGRHKPLYMMQGLDATADLVFMVGYHGSISGESSVLSHTYNPAVVSHVALNGTRVGESGINALVALACQAPVGLITGDQHTIAEADPFLPDAERVVVKESFTRFGAANLHPEVARELIADGARRAVEVTYITRVSEGRLRRGPGRGAGDLVAVPAGQGGVPVQRQRHPAVGQLRLPVLGGHPPQDLELDAARVLGVQRLGHAVVALPHQRPGGQQPGPGVGQVAQRADLPGQVVQAGVFGLVGRVTGADLEQAEVVVVGRARRAEERGAAGNLHPDLEAEGLPIEVHGALQTVHVQDSVVEAADGHRRFLSGSADGGFRAAGDAAMGRASSRRPSGRRSRGG
jgi:D-amino peptidase